MMHTYFSHDRQWDARGTYYDERGNSFPISGLAQIIHTEKEWVLDGFMEVGFAEPVRFHNKYAIAKTNDENTLD